jgi:hypothetical protein
MAVASPFFSEGHTSLARHRAPRALALVSLVALLAGAGCVTVRPEEREFLADSSMNFGTGGEADAHEEHVLSNREGSIGAGEFSGGGCGCN